MQKSGFTLIEIMISVLITTIIMLWWFAALSAVTIGKVRLIEKTNIEKEASYFSEKLFEMIKSGGTLDYEEYWNRKVVDHTNFSGWHFAEKTGFGNFWQNGDIGNVVNISDYGNPLYYCLSWNAAPMGVNGCLIANNIPNIFENVNTSGISQNYTGIAQRYGQYELQFINLNINDDGDAWFTVADLPGDENWDGNVLWDDDDEYLGEGPEVFTSGDEVTELYLISGDKQTRTYFRYSVIADPDSPSPDCDLLTNARFPSWTGCLWTIQFLKLKGKDWWLDHTPTGPADDDGTQFDGIIDTWIIDPSFATGNIVADSTSTEFWEDLFPKTMNVSDFSIYAYPHKDRNLAWKNNTPDVNIAPYIRISLKIQPSWKKRKLIKGSLPELDLSTTISLNELYSQ